MSGIHVTSSSTYYKCSQTTNVSTLLWLIENKDEKILGLGLSTACIILVSTVLFSMDQ